MRSRQQTCKPMRKYKRAYKNHAARQNKIALCMRDVISCEALQIKRKTKSSLGANDWDLLTILSKNQSQYTAVHILIRTFRETLLALSTKIVQMITLKFDKLRSSVTFMT